MVGRRRVDRVRFGCLAWDGTRGSAVDRSQGRWALRRWLLNGAGVALVLVVAAPNTGAAAATPGSDPCSVPVGVAHRGAVAAAPENSAAGMRAALREGVGVVEGDVRFTADGTAVLMHDATVDRTTSGRGLVSALSAPAFQRLRLTDGQRPPTLHAVLRLVATYGGHMFVEVKDPLSPTRIRTLLGAIDATGASVTVLTWRSTDLDALRAARRGLTLGWVDGVTPRTPAEITRRAPVLVKSAAAVNATTVRAWRAAGIATYAWTANTPAEWARLRDAGVDGVITDDILGYRAWRAAGCRAATGRAIG